MRVARSTFSASAAPAGTVGPVYGVPTRVLAKACGVTPTNAGAESGEHVSPTLNMPVDGGGMPANELPSLVGRQPVAPPPPSHQPAPQPQPGHQAPGRPPTDVDLTGDRFETPWRYRGVLTTEESPTAQPSQPALSGMDTNTAFRPIGDPNVFASSGPRRFRPQEPPPRRPSPPAPNPVHNAPHMAPHRGVPGHPPPARGRVPHVPPNGHRQPAPHPPEPIWPPAR
jgi:hypothetical protein